MDINQLTIAKKDSSEKYVFSSKVNLIISTDLSDEILKENFKIESTNFYFESLDNLPLNETLQIKVNIAEAGIMMINFKKDDFAEEKKDSLIKEISSLKNDDKPTFDTQKEKISKLIELLEKYHPIFVAYASKGEFVFVKSTFEEITNEKEISFPILVLLNSLFFQEESNKKESKLFKRLQNGEKKEGSFKLITQIKTLDFIFFAIFSSFISFSLFTTFFEIQNNETVFIFLLILCVAFFAILNYATYKAYIDLPYFKYKIKNLIVPLCYILIGITLGIVIGYLITANVIKPKEDIIINYSIIYAISIPLSLGLSIASLFMPIPLNKFIKKIKAKQKQ